MLFHDDMLERVTGEPGAIADYTYEKLRDFFVRKDEFYDKIIKLEDFLAQSYFRDMTFAIELKSPNAETLVADLVAKYQMEKKVVVTSFHIDYIRKIKEYAPQLRVGLLTGEVTDDIIEELKRIRADELCPEAKILSPEKVNQWHREGFRVRAWGVYDETLMKKAYDSQVDGVTVNFPDILTAYIKESL